jgi:uncharacterized protein (TIGR03435 family)
MTKLIPAALATALAAVGLFAQSKPAPEFEVASIRPTTEAGYLANQTPTLDVEPGRNLQFHNLQVGDLITLAYGVGIRQVSGADWIYNSATNDSLRYDVIAKVPADATREQIPAMLQQLLADRFKLAVHREQKPLPVYVLDVAKGGPMLQETPPEDRRAPGCTRGFGQPPGEGMTIAADCHGLTMAALAVQLQTLAPGYFRDGPVLDRTGLKGKYDLRLEWIRVQEYNEGAKGPTMYKTVEKFGLTLEKRKEPMEVLVVDHCERTPTEN